MGSGQGAFEYLLIGVAVMGLLIGVLLVLNSVLAPAAEQRDVQMDIIECGDEHLWLKAYTVPYNGIDSNTAPGSLTYYGATLELQSGSGSPTAAAKETCQLQAEHWLTFDRNTRTAWLEMADGSHLVYKGEGSSGNGGSKVTLWLTGHNGNENSNVPLCTISSKTGIDIPQSGTVKLTFDSTAPDKTLPGTSVKLILWLAQNQAGDTAAPTVQFEGGPQEDLADTTAGAKKEEFTFTTTSTKSPLYVTLTGSSWANNWVCDGKIEVS